MKSSRIHCPLAMWPAPCGPDGVRLVQATKLARDTALPSQGSLATRIRKAHQRAGAMEEVGRKEDEPIFIGFVPGASFQAYLP